MLNLKNSLLISKFTKTYYIFYIINYLQNLKVVYLFYYNIKFY